MSYDSLIKIVVKIFAFSENRLYICFINNFIKLIKTRKHGKLN